MANIEKIKVGSTTYDIRDATAPHELTDIAIAGDNVTFVVDPYIDNIAATNKHNSPTITNAGIYAGTSSDTSFVAIGSASISSYTTILGGNYSWSWTVKFKTPDDVTQTAYIYKMEGQGGDHDLYNEFVTLSAFPSPQSKRINVHFLTSDGRWVDVLGTTEVQPNTWYWLRFSRDYSASKYILELSTNGITWNEEGYLSDSAAHRTTFCDLFVSHIPYTTGDVTYAAMPEYDFTGFSFTSNYYSSGMDFVAWEYTPKTAINATGFLKNTATGSNSLSILGTTTSNTYVTNAGYLSSALNYGTALGYGASTSSNGTYGTAIGYGTSATQSHAIAIGSSANSAGTSSVAIGDKAYAYGSYSIYIGYSYGSNYTTGQYSICIGYNSSTRNANNAVAIGYVSSSGQNGVAVGYGAYGSQEGIGIGHSALSNAQYAIQLGQGTNNNANTFSVGLSSSLNVQLLDSTGTIPFARQANAIIGGASDPDTTTVGTVGLLYRNTTDGGIFKCTDTTGSVYTWEELGAGGGSASYDSTTQTITL